MRSVISLSLACFLSASPANAQAVQEPASSDRAITEEARNLLDQVVKAYAALDHYHDRGSVIFSLDLDGEKQTMEIPLRLDFRRADAKSKSMAIAIDAGAARLVCDGKTDQCVNVASKTFYGQPHQGTLSPASIADTPVGALLLGGPARFPAEALLSLLLGPSPASILSPPGSSLTREMDESQEGKSLGVLLLKTESAAFKLVIDPTTHLLSRIEAVITPEAGKEAAPPGAKADNITLRWDPAAVSTELLEGDPFRLENPAGYTEIKPLGPPE